MSREKRGLFESFFSFLATKQAVRQSVLRRALTGFALALFVNTIVFAGTSEPEIAWVEDLDQAMHLSKIHNKPLMIHFYGDHCPPCRMLEAKAFRNRELVLILNDNVIATKVNADKYRDVAQRYQVTRWPTDVYLHADGTVIERGVSNQDPQAYSRTVARVSQRHRDWALARVASRDAQERRDQQVATSELSRFRSKIFGEAATRTAPVRVTSADWGRGTSMPQTSDMVAANSQVPRGQVPQVQIIDVETQLAASGKLSHAPTSSDAHLVSPAHDSSSQSITQHQISQIAEVTAVPGLGGFCPVALQDYLRMPPQVQAQRSPWVPGREEFSVRHRGRIYRCASADSRERLLRDPDGFAPVFSGCDLVEFAKTGVLVDGKCDLGFIEQNSGRVFLFATRASYEEFARNCEHYSSLSEPQQDRMAQGQPTTNVR